MPNPAEPIIKSWVSFLSKTVGDVDKETFFVGHSIGCQAIMRYFETLPDNKRVGGVVFVAGWFTLSDLETDEDRRVARPWVETPVNFQKVKSIGRNFTYIFSDNDPVVPTSNRDIFREKLDSKILVEHNKGHIGGADGITELLSVLGAILNFVK